MTATGTILCGREQHERPAVLLPHGYVNLGRLCPTF